MSSQKISATWLSLRPIFRVLASISSTMQWPAAKSCLVFSWLVASCFAFAPLASAITCSSAQSSSEITICNSVAAMAADHELESSYSGLQKKISPSQKKALKESQIAWLQDRDVSCSSQRDEELVLKCLILQTEARSRFLQGKPDAGSGVSGQLMPFFVFKPKSNRQAQILVESVKFSPAVGSGEEKFNEEVEKFLQQNASDSEVMGEAGGRFFVLVHTEITYASPKFISVRMSYENYLGQAHPFRFQSNINVDLRQGRLLTLDDIVERSATQTIYQFCKAYISQEKRQRDIAANQPVTDENINLDEVASFAADLRAWSFDGTTAIIGFPSNAFGGYGECDCDCRIPYSKLFPLKKKHSILD